MPTITFFTQTRQDGGVRSGVDVDETTALGLFRPGRSSEPDPALLWYVDVRCTGAGLPREGEAARRWLVRHMGQIRKAPEFAADEIPAGIDPGDWPFRREMKNGSSSTRILISCSAMRKIDARKLAAVLKGVANKWQETIESLSPLAEVI
jgi:hypothetical protein